MKEERSGAALGAPEWTERESPAAKAADPREKKGARALFREVWLGGAYALFGYLLGSCALPFGAYPLGVAWLCAAERRVLWIFGGLCLSAVGLSHPVWQVLAYALALFVRVLVRLTVDKPGRGRRAREHTLGSIGAALFSEAVGLRMTTAALAVFFLGTYRLLSGGFLYYDLWGSLLSLAVAPLFVLALSGVSRNGADARSDVWRQVGILSLSCALVYASRTLTFAYISVAAFGAMGVTLYMTKRRGIVCGVLTGALCGLAYMPALSPLFAFGALAGGLLLPTSATLATLVTVAVSTAWAFYARGLGALDGLFPAILAASVLFAVADKLFASVGQGSREDARDETGEKVCDARCEVLSPYALDHVRLCDAAERIEMLCESFSGMAELLSHRGEELRERSPEALRTICASAFDSSCASCEGREVCRERDCRKTDAEIDRLASVLYREGRVTAESVDEALLGRCTRLPDILDEIGHNARLYWNWTLEEDRGEIFSVNYAATAEVLGRTMAAEHEEYEVDAALSARICEQLPPTLGVVGVLSWGWEQRQVMLVSDNALSEDAEHALLALLSRECGVRMKKRAEKRGADGRYESLFSPCERLRVRVAQRTARADGESEFCGDTVGVFSHGGVQYAFISDGMGAGREAARTSGICALFLEKMLSAGNACDTVIRMLNGFLRNRRSGSMHECSATVDLMALDLCGGEAEFYKCGAAPTYVLREGSLFKLRSKTLPVGILREPDQKRIALEIREGDVIVMVSDGVTQGREECPWLFALLQRSIDRLGLDETAERILRRARSEGSTDDLSVLILAVEAF